MKVSLSSAQVRAEWSLDDSSFSESKRERRLFFYSCWFRGAQDGGKVQQRQCVLLFKMNGSNLLPNISEVIKNRV